MNENGKKWIERSLIVHDERRWDSSECWLCLTLPSLWGDNQSNALKQLLSENRRKSHQSYLIQFQNSKHLSSEARQFFFTVFIVCVGNWQWGELKLSNPIKRKERPNWMGKPPWPILWQFLHVRIFCLLNPCRRVLGFPMGWIIHRLVRNTLYGLGLVGLT